MKAQAAPAAAQNNKIFLVPLHLMSCLQFFILQSKNHQELVVVPLEITLSCPMRIEQYGLLEDIVKKGKKEKKNI
ncbi:hypothetical protein HID58_014157 [Brassica napus]|uniref:Uncharacterized protein n=1 Tax=Brassica napus TaxID=3708 RepID=A0ABQ8DGC9_BRANA|nr:hypothetical protein HID58_014157 [Brassica napus]